MQFSPSDPFQNNHLCVLLIVFLIEDNLRCFDS